MASTGKRRWTRIVAWAAVLTLAAVAGFVYGAFTYVPPAPELEGAPTSARSTPLVTSPPPATSTVSPDEAVVPDLVGRHRTSAETVLAELGVLWVVDPVKGRDDDVVVRQNPAAGEPIRPSTSVLLQVRCDPRPCPQPPEGRNLYDPCACLWR